MANYLNPGDPGAFQDLEKKDKTKFNPEEYEECPTCRGYGGWNLTLNAYGPGEHFRCCCGDCLGWGYVRQGAELRTRRIERLMTYKDRVKIHWSSRGRSSTTALIEVTGEIPPADLHDTLVIAADGWWPNNFGGLVQYAAPGHYRVTVYTD